MKIDQNLEEELIELIKSDLSGSSFEGEERAALSHFINSGHTIPDIYEETYQKISEKIIPTSVPAARFSFIDLFAGIGGFRLGLQRSGGKAVFSSEWDKSAKQTYYKNHEEYPFGDINIFTNEKVGDNTLGALIPSHDILAGGFPCQPFSRAGVSARNSLGVPHGFECSTQGTLYYSIERIAKAKKPKILFLENVRNLVSHDEGRTFETIKKSIDELGYKFFSKIIDAQTLVPQRRQRCFIVAVRKDIYKKFGAFKFPVFEGEPLPLRSILQDDAPSEYTISDKLWKGHQTRSKRNKERGTGFTTSVANLDKPSNTIVARYGKDGKECLIPQDGKPPRMLTVDEARQLFGYPEGFKLPQYRTPAYKQLGNSVAVPVVEKIASAIIKQYFAV